MVSHHPLSSQFCAALLLTSRQSCCLAFEAISSSTSAQSQCPLGWVLLSHWNPHCWNRNSYFLLLRALIRSRYPLAGAQVSTPYTFFRLLGLVGCCVWTHSSHIDVSLVVVAIHSSDPCYSSLRLPLLLPFQKAGIQLDFLLKLRPPVLESL